MYSKKKKISEYVIVRRYINKIDNFEKSNLKQEILLRVKLNLEIKKIGGYGNTYNWNRMSCKLFRFK